MFLGDRYQLQDPPGRDGMFLVYHGRDIQMDRDVVIKVLREVYSTDPKFVTRFQREAKAASSLLPLMCMHWASLCTRCSQDARRLTGIRQQPWQCSTCRMHPFLPASIIPTFLRLWRRLFCVAWRKSQRCAIAMAGNWHMP